MSPLNRSSPGPLPSHFRNVSDDIQLFSMKLLHSVPCRRVSGLTELGPLEQVVFDKLRAYAFQPLLIAIPAEFDEEERPLLQKKHFRATLARNILPTALKVCRRSSTSTASIFTASNREAKLQTQQCETCREDEVCGWRAKRQGMPSTHSERAQRITHASQILAFQHGRRNKCSNTIWLHQQFSDMLGLSTV